MALVIVNKNVTKGEGEKLYMDALVSEGSLYLTDFSNLGALKQFNVKNNATVNNLAQGAAVELGVISNSYISTPKADSALTAKKGLTADGIIGGGAYGLIIPNVMDYLSKAEVQSHNILFNIWLNTGTSGVARGFVRTWGGGTDWANTAFRCNIAIAGNPTFTIGGAVVQETALYPEANKIVQCSYLYQGVGQKIKVWINGVYKGETAQLATGFNAAGKSIVIGKPEIPQTGNQEFFRFSIEDLTVSGRDANAVVQKDYNYVNQLGEYSDKPTKRPYANV